MGGTGSGRVKTPTGLKRLRGNPGRRPLPKGEPEFAPMTTLEPLSFLSVEAKAEWTRLAKPLTLQGILTMADVAAFACYCESWATFKRATEELSVAGDIVSTRDGMRPSPYHRIRNAAFDHLKTFACQFGLTPSARTKIVAPATDPDNEFTRWKKKYCTK
jgi:P27 family predicted phage terminase small subunit